MSEGFGGHIEGWGGTRLATAELIERARNHKMTPHEKFEQRVSFVYGQQDWSARHQFTKDEVRSRLSGA